MFGPDLDPYNLTPWFFFPEISWKYLFWKESADDNKITKYVACKELYKKFNAVWSGTIFLFFEQNNLFTKKVIPEDYLKGP